MGAPSRLRRRALAALLAAAAAGAASGQSVPTFFQNQSDGSVLLVRGDSSGVNTQPFGFLKGAVASSDPATLAFLAKQGVNTVRTYDATMSQDVLENAAAVGLSVIVGIQLPPVATSLTSYSTTTGQSALISQIVAQSYSNLLAYCLGNDVARPPYAGYNAVFQLLQRAAVALQAADPAHPVGTCVTYYDAASFGANLLALNQNAPAIQFLGVNAYGPAATLLPTALRSNVPSGSAWSRPWLMSEFGPAATWQVPQTPWGDWLEDTSSARSGAYAALYALAVQSASRVLCSSAANANCYGVSLPATTLAGAPVPPGGLVPAGANGAGCVGAFATYVGWEWRASPAWNALVNGYNYTTPAAGEGGLLAGGETLEPLDALSYLWGGAFPPFRAPTLSGPVTLNGMTPDMAVQLQVGRVAAAAVAATDPNGLPLQYTWLVLPLPASPTDTSVYPPVPYITGPAGALQFLPPTTPGAYRLAVWVSNSKGKTAYASIPFYAVITTAATAAYDNGDAYVMDGANSTFNYGTGPTLQLASGQPVGQNAFAYLAFGAPAGSVVGAPPGTVLLNFFVPGTQTLSAALTGVNAYAVPNNATWNENTVIYAGGPCTPSAAVAMPGLCNVLEGRTTAVSNAYVPPAVGSPVGLPAVGAYFAIDITLATAAALGNRVNITVLLTSTSAGPASLTLASREYAAGRQRAPYIWVAPPVANISVAASIVAATATPAAALQSAVQVAAAANANVAPALVAVRLVGFSVAASLLLVGSPGVTLTEQQAAALAAGLGTDLGVDPTNVVVLPATPANVNVEASVANSNSGRRRSARRRLAQLFGTTEVPFMVNGFHTGTDVGAAAAAAAAGAINTLLAASNSATSAALRAAGVPFMSLGQGQIPAVLTQLTIEVPTTSGVPASDAAALTRWAVGGSLDMALANAGVVADVAPMGSFVATTTATQMSLYNSAPYGQGAGATALMTALMSAVSAAGSGSGGNSSAPTPESSASGNTTSTSTTLSDTSVLAVVVVSVAALFVSGTAVCAAAGALLMIKGAAGGAEGMRLSRLEAIILGRVLPEVNGGGANGAGNGSGPYEGGVVDDDLDRHYYPPARRPGGRGGRKIPSDDADF